MHVAGEDQMYAVVGKGVDQLLRFGLSCVADERKDRLAGKHGVMLHGDHHLAVGLRLLCLRFDPAEEFVVIGDVLLSVNVVADHKQPHVVGKLRHIGQVFLVARNGVVEAEIAVITEQLAELRSLRRSSAGIGEAERRVVEIVARSHNIDLFSALFPEII